MICRLGTRPESACAALCRHCRHADHRCRRFCCLLSIFKRPFCPRRRRLAHQKRTCQCSGRLASDLVFSGIDGLLARYQYQLLARVAAVADAPGRLSCHEPYIARCRSTPDLADSAEISRSRRIFGGLAICLAPGERGIGGLDRLAQERDGHVVFPAVDLLVSWLP